MLNQVKELEKTISTISIIQNCKKSTYMVLEIM